MCMLMFIPLYGIFFLMIFLVMIRKYTVLDEQWREAKEGKLQRQKPRSTTSVGIYICNGILYTVHVISLPYISDVLHLIPCDISLLVQQKSSLSSNSLFKVKRAQSGLVQQMPECDDFCSKFVKCKLYYTLF